MIHISPTATDTDEASVLYRNVLAEGTLSWSSETPDGFAANALGPQTFDFWTPATVPAALSVTLADPVLCDCAAIIAHTLGSTGATLHIQYLSGAVWTTVASVTPTDDSDILLLFGGVSADRWRVHVSVAVASIGVAMIGPRLLIPLGVVPDYIPLNQAVTVDLMNTVTRGGQFIGNRIQRVGAGTSIALAPQERDWIETTAVGFITHFNEGHPFVWSSCPALLPDDLGYCWRSGGHPFGGYGAGAITGALTLEVQAYVGR